MTIATVTYCFIVTGTLGLAARAAESVLTDHNLPTRWLWFAAMVTSIVLPAASLLFPEQELAILKDALPPEALNAARELLNVSINASLEKVPNTSDTSETGMPIGLIMTVLWCTSSMALLATLACASIKLHRSINQAEIAVIDGRTVSLHDAYGPAVVGFFRPKIVMPEWLVNEPEETVAIVLQHENEHVAARDHQLLQSALLLLCLMPWNLLLWWHLRQLRISIEIDCDNRLLSNGNKAAHYARTLLQVSQRSSDGPFNAVALTESASELEKRIKIMTQSSIQPRPVAVCARLSVAILLVSCILIVDSPHAQPDDRSSSPMPILQVRPYYPPEAILEGLTEGKVTVEYTVNAEGLPEEIAVVEASSPVFEQAAVDAAAKSKYMPYMENEIATPVSGVRQIISFDMIPERDLSAQNAELFASLFDNNPSETNEISFDERSAEEQVRLLTLYSNLLVERQQQSNQAIRQFRDALDQALTLMNESGQLDD